jgi:hypothetical protein
LLQRAKTPQRRNQNYNLKCRRSIQNSKFPEKIRILTLLWSLPWKGVALWKAARNSQKGWYIALLILQTLGILEILYIFKFQKDRNLAEKT